MSLLHNSLTVCMHCFVLIIFIRFLSYLIFLVYLILLTNVATCKSWDALVLSA